MSFKLFEDNKLTREPIQFATFPDPLYAQNSRVVYVPGETGCWVVDPGLPPTSSQIYKCLEDNGLSPEAFLLTHAHVDHIAGLQDLLDRYPFVPVYLAPEEHSFLVDPSQNLSIVLGQPVVIHPAEVRGLDEGLELALSDTRWRVLATPGHSPGGRTFYQPESGVAIVGDTLFAGSVGRTDFPHSNGPLMFKCIREKLLTLPDQTRVLSGHGPDTTIETEKHTNPFLVGRFALDA